MIDEKKSNTSPIYLLTPKITNINSIFLRDCDWNISKCKRKRNACFKREDGSNTKQRNRFKLPKSATATPPVDLIRRLECWSPPIYRTLCQSQDSHRYEPTDSKTPCVAGTCTLWSSCNIYRDLLVSASLACFPDSFAPS